jgi:hypothetical protein
MKKWLIRIPLALLAIIALAIWQLYFSARPSLMTDPISDSINLEISKTTRINIWNIVRFYSWRRWQKRIIA